MLRDMAEMVEQQNAALQAIKIERDLHAAEIERLRLLIKQLQRMQFGRRSERLDPDQLQLALEDLEQAVAAAQAAQEDAAAKPGTGTAAVRPPPRRNRGALPAHLPRVEVLLDIAEKSCPCCGGTLHEIGADVSEMLDVIPAQFRVKVIRRPRYGCRRCEGAVVQAPAPDRVLTGGLATEALVAHVLVSKFLDHLPLYRQSQIMARQGLALDRSTLADWVGRAGWWLRPLWEQLRGSVLRSTRIFADDTPVPVLAPGTGKTKTGRLWAYARDDRPWAGAHPPAVVYVYSADRKGVHPATHLSGFTGVLQVDGYRGFTRLSGTREAGTVRLAFCWAHARRRFYEFHQATGSPLAGEALRRIAALYAIEETIRGRPPDERRRVRQETSRPQVEALKLWLEAQLGRVSSKSALAEAIRYTLRHWEGLIAFLDDGRIDLDTNTVERAMRPIALGRKNHLFAGSEAGAHSWAIIASLLQTARLNDLEPFAYLRDILERIVSGAVKTPDLPSLLPWAWKETYGSAANA
nr:IS66 family transposase [Azospirillum canadense]